jgi:uncharacterized protein (DUF2141 family)
MRGGAAPVRWILLTGLLGAAAMAVHAAAAPNASLRQHGQLRVELSGMGSDAGALVYALWSGPEHWLDSDPLREGRVPVENGESLIVLDALPYGEYALSAYHDLNDNRQLDTGLFRIPKEPLGISNDARSRFGPPKYEDARFQLDDRQLTIRIAVKKLF